MRNDWLKDIKPGDLVIVRGTGLVGETVETVERLTKTQIVLKERTTRYRRDSGRQVSSYGWSSTWLCSATHDEVKRIEDDTLKRKLAIRLRDTAWAKKSLAELQAIESIIEKFEKVENQKKTGRVI